MNKAAVRETGSVVTIAVILSKDASGKQRPKPLSPWAPVLLPRPSPQSHTAPFLTPKPPTKTLTERAFFSKEDWVLSKKDV